jgi:formate hydrogenlyase transcriptional activator
MERKKENGRQRRNLAQPTFEGAISASSALRAVLKQVELVASTESTVLILGETGTGKEPVARAVHKRSQRSSRAFVSVNCAVIPRYLIASELFGHEKGAWNSLLSWRLLPSVGPIGN